tara:strand:- start:790 stop:918 length:129 start_codon:yes stop_codon:yes gene_type:complete
MKLNINHVIFSFGGLVPVGQVNGIAAKNNALSFDLIGSFYVG